MVGLPIDKLPQNQLGRMYIVLILISSPKSMRSVHVEETVERQLPGVRGGERTSNEMSIAVKWAPEI